MTMKGKQRGRGYLLTLDVTDAKALSLYLSSGFLLPDLDRRCTPQLQARSDELI